MAKHTLIYDGDTVPHRFKSHVVEIGVGALSAVVGGMIVAGAIFDPATYAASALSSLPTIAVALLGAVHLCAGILISVGLLIARSDVAEEIHTEQFGWILAAGGWLGFGWCMWYFAEGASVGIAFGVIIGVVSGLRGRYLSEVEEQTRERVRKAGGRA